MSFWSDLFGDSKRDSKRKKTRKKVAKKKASKSKTKDYVIFDKYDDKLIMRVKAKSDGAAARMVKSDDHRIMTSARWDREHGNS